MRRNILLISIFLKLSLIGQCQSLGFESYLKHSSFYQELKGDFLNFTVAPEQIKSITETRIKLDSLGNDIDTTYLYRYYFDELGQLIDKPFWFDSSKTKFISRKYSYENGICVDSVTQNLYSNMQTVLDGYFVNSPERVEYKYDRNKRLIYEYVTFWEGPYDYVSLEYYYSGDKLKTVEINTSNGNWVHEIYYDIYKKKNY